MTKLLEAALIPWILLFILTFKDMVRKNDLLTKDSYWMLICSFYFTLVLIAIENKIIEL